MNKTEFVLNRARECINNGNRSSTAIIKGKPANEVDVDSLYNDTFQMYEECKVQKKEIDLS